MVLELVISDDNGLTGVDLRRHRGEHNLLGKGGCRRLAKLVPSHAIDNGIAAELKFTFVEWLVAPILMPDEAVQNEFLYGYVMGYERMGVALDRALSKIKDDQPRHAGVLRAQLRRLAESDFAKGGAGTEAYVVGVPDLYEVASAFPTGNGVDGLYDWIGLWTFTLCGISLQSGTLAKVLSSISFKHPVFYTYPSRSSPAAPWYCARPEVWARVAPSSSTKSLAGQRAQRGSV